MSEQDEYIRQLKARINELETTMDKLATSAFNVITYWRNKYENK
jgi:hypothetical protein